jgi:hypothetical protein
MLALDAGGQRLLVSIEAPKGDFTSWTKSAEKILSTLTLKRGG